MIARIKKVPAGTTRGLAFNTIYPETWSVPEKRGEDVLAADIAAARFLLKRRLGTADADAAIEKTLDEGITKENGTVTVLLEPEDTAELQGTYFATLRLTLIDGSVLDWEDTEYPDVPFVQIDITQGAVEAVS